MENLSKTIISLNNHYNHLDAEIGIYNADNSGLIFSRLTPMQRGDLMNSIRGRDFNNSTRITKKKITTKIKSIVNTLN